MAESILRLIAQVATVAVTAKTIHWLRTAKDASLPRTRNDGTKIYGIKLPWRAVGLITAVFGGVLAVIEPHDRHSTAGWVSLIFFPMMVILGLWLASGLVTTDSVGIKKRMLWRSHSLRWEEITEIRLLGKDIGAIALRAGSKKLIIESRFLAFRHLLDEIRSYTNLQPVGTLPQWPK